MFSPRQNSACHPFNLTLPFNSCRRALIPLDFPSGFKIILSFVLVTLLFLSTPGAGGSFASERIGNGLKAEITGAKISQDRRLVVSFRISDADGRPLRLEDLDENSIRFTIAALRSGINGESSYQNYVLSKVAGKDFVYKGEKRKPAIAETLQPDYDRGGTFKAINPGTFSYTFKTVLPLGYDKKATHIVGGELTRERRKHVINPLYEFIPAGGRVTIRRAVVGTASCNICHDPLKMHGGFRRETGYCVLCHTSQLTDPESGQNLEFKVLIHKIHRGRHLPSVKEKKPFFIVGMRQRIFDYTDLGYPQDIRNCQTCHAGSHGAQWMNAPGVAACTSCHDNVDLSTGKSHVAGAQAEGSCSGCHPAQGVEFGPSVQGAHTIPRKSEQVAGVVFEILQVQATQPGGNPEITFSVKNKKGEALEAAKMANLRLVLAWPTMDYRVAIEEDARKAAPSGDGVYSYKFRYTLPADASGSGAVGIQGFTEPKLTKPDGKPVKERVRDVGFNAVKYFPITDREAVPRRQVVKVESCNGCHERLALHGEARQATAFCVMCHHAAQNDEEKRKAAKGPMPPENVHFKRLIMKLHTGKELGEPLVVYGGSPSRPAPVDLGKVRFPGDRRNCHKCHEKGTADIPLPEGVLPSLIPQAGGGVKSVPAIAAACTACHTSQAALAHVETQTTAEGRESCVVCHGLERHFAVEKVHAR